MQNYFLIHQHILVTRCSPQGEELCSLLEKQGAIAHHIPTLDIQPHAVNVKFLQPDIAIFISVNAVKYCPLQQLSSSVKCYAVGEATARALMGRGIITQYAREGNSEGLLALADLQNVHNKKVAIFCGVGGRELLYETLCARGALCQRYEVYQRHCAIKEMNRLQNLLKSTSINCVICTSGENLLCLQKLAGTHVTRLYSIPLVVISKRVAEIAYASGFCQVFVIEKSFNNHVIVDQLIKWRNQI